MRYHWILLSILSIILVPATSIYAVQSRVALVIGNNAYRQIDSNNLIGPLANPNKDAIAMARALERYGFNVALVKDVNLQQMEAEINKFAQQLRTGSVGLFYFSGHGVQVDGANYLIPVGRKFGDPDDVKYGAIVADKILGKMERSGALLNIMILDACRAPFPDNLTKNFGRKGLTEMKARGETLIGYAAAPGDIAYDVYNDQTLPNSLYTYYLLESMRQNGHVQIEQVFDLTQKLVANATERQQLPWNEDGVTRDFCFGGCSNQSTLSPSPDISQLLQTCEQHFQENRLTTGNEGTALDCYREVLQQDPSNTQARTGMQRIETRYVEWAQQALSDGQQEKAQQYIAGLRRVNSDSSTLAVLEAQLEAQLFTEPVHTPSSVPVHSFPSVREQQIRDMVRQYGHNWPAKGIRGRLQHQYDVQTRQGEKVNVDYTTGLMWQQSGSSSEMSWYQVNKYINQLNAKRYGGYSDWRLPTIGELASLLEASKLNNGVLFISQLFDITQAYCWSSDMDDTRRAAWIVIFANNGNIYPDDIESAENYVRAVRSLR